MSFNQRSQSYWAEVGEREQDLRAEFGDAVFLIDRGTGCTVQTATRDAARCLAGGTHRLATPEEIDAWQATDARRKRFQEAIEAASKRTLNLRVAPAQKETNHAD